MLGIPFELFSGGTLTLNHCTKPILRGTLMGIPLSFPTLTLIHYWFCRYIVNAPVSSFYIKGDDLISLWPSRLIKFYSQNLQKYTGMVPNSSKEFISRNRGLFCEKPYQLFSGDRDTGGLYVNRFYVSVKGLVPKKSWTHLSPPLSFSGYEGFSP